MSLVVGMMAVAGSARADEIPTVTITDVGPNQDIPAGRTFYLAGAAAPEVHGAQAIVVRTGSARLLGDHDPDCDRVMRELRIDASAHSAADDGVEDEESDEDAQLDIPTLRVGTHRAFELFDRADLAIRDAAILVSAPWRRTDENERQYRVLVPSDGEFFATGHGYCLFVVTTDHKQGVEETTLSDLIDGLGKVGLTITAPLGIHPGQALVTTRIGGVPQLVAAPVDLHAVDGFATGLLTLVAPQSGVGAWQIDVQVAGFTVPSIEAYVQ